tara:strand:+ start:1066 stop:1284 length:219 start_codon:yes stop_codon:yes gene_type:complete
MMSKENQIITVSGFLGFAIGVCSMMFVSQPPGKQCYDIIKEIEYQVCEDCWYDVFDGGDKYQEVEYYETWEY